MSLYKKRNQHGIKTKMISKSDVENLLHNFNAREPVKINASLISFSSPLFLIHIATERAFMRVNYNSQRMTRAGFLKRLAKDCAKLIAREVMDYATYNNKPIFGSMTDNSAKRYLFGQINKWRM